MNRYEIHIHRFRSCVAAIALLVGFAGCTQYSTVSERNPKFPEAPRGVGLLAQSESAIKQGLRTGSRKENALAALDLYLEAAHAAAEALLVKPNDEVAHRDYNFAVSRVIMTIQRQSLNPWDKPLIIPSAKGHWTLTHKRDPRPQWNPTLYHFTPADQFDIGGTYVAKRSVKDGFGAPVVAVGKKPREDAKERFTLKNTYYGVTALIRFDPGRKAVLMFEDPLTTENVRWRGRTVPLAADYTVPLAVMLAKENPKKLELSRLLNPEKFAETAGVTRLQPYEPHKTVVLVVHGLMDSPATWTPMLNALRSDASIRKNFQFWMYSYPSGYPYPHSAAILRQQLDAIEKRYPLQKPMVLIGHSMGSLISRLMITDSGTKIWNTYYPRPPEKMGFSESTLKFTTESLIFNHRPEVGRVIFISGPHRGAELASTWLARQLNKLVHTPSTLMNAGREIGRAVSLNSAKGKVTRIPTSVDTLSPNNRFVKVINTIPTTPGVPYHTISGDRGKGGNKDRTKPVMSDGIVPYWSSHLEGAQSELVVPSNHSAHQDEQAIHEVRRILHSHSRN